MELFFPDLTKLKPTILSTVLKATEEYGELSREVHNISNAKNNQKELQKNIPIVLGELLDVAQTMFTLIYFMQKTNMMSSNFLEERLETHVSKLVNKGYLDSSLKKDNQYKNGFHQNGDMFIILPRCNKIVFSSVETGILLTTLKLGEEIGELAQAVGKHSGLSGEVNVKTDDVILQKIVDSMLDVAQTCCTLLYIFQDEYRVDVESLLISHRKKLEEHGYC